MKISVDYEKCEGLGMCESMAHEFFEVDEDEDQVVVLNENPPEEHRAQVKAAVESCPVLALTLEG